MFPFSSTAECTALLQPQLVQLELHKFPKQNLVIGGDLLTTPLSDTHKKSVLPSIFQQNFEMSEEIAADLRHWLVEPQAPKDQRTSAFLELLDEKQKNLVSSRTEKTGYRKIRGPAGSGKTLILCGRAARLLAEEKKVLFVTYNITLINYIGDLIVRSASGGDFSRNRIRKQLTILNFHYFCKRIALTTGNMASYNELMRNQQESSMKNKDELLEFELPKAAASWVKQFTEENKYDAILVDEGQDFRLEWWNILRDAHRNGGEMMLSADRTQNIYGRDQAWTERPLTGSGLVGGWIDLKICYRMPPEMCREATRFVDLFLPGQDNIRPISATNGGGSNVDMFEAMPDILGRTTRLGWIQHPKNTSPVEFCFQALMSMVLLSEDCTLPINYADAIFLVEDKQVGIGLRKRLLQNNINVVDTFDDDEITARRKKLSFRKGDGRVKITTIHSYKGFETRALIVQINTAKSKKDYALFYAAITRLKMCPPESYLTVVCSAPELEQFGAGWNR